MKERLDEMTKNRHVIVFSGFSALGYKDIHHLKESLHSELEKAISKYGAHALCVVAGATDEGIGVVYNLAKKMGIETLGIVSEQAIGFVSSNCDKVVYIADPTGSWKVLDETGNSYMVYVATRNDKISRTGEFIAFGGGEVTLSELNEARSIGVTYKVYPYFEPDPEKAIRKLKTNPKIDLTPVKKFYGSKNTVRE